MIYKDKVMNYSYKKKPIVIQAFQMTLERRNDNRDWPEWLNKVWNAPEGDINSLSIDPDDISRQKLCIRTLEGLLDVSWDDWIIQGIKGELYPCKPDIFLATYDELDGGA